MTTSTSSEPYDSLIVHVGELIDAGYLRDARRILAQFIERKRLDSKLLPALAALYLRVGKSIQAISTIHTAMQRLGPSAELHNTLGLIYASIGKETESRQEFEKALGLDPEDADAMRNLAFSLHRSGKKARAYQLLIRCYDCLPLSSELRLICGTLLELDGRNNEASCCYREVIEISSVGEQVEIAERRLGALRHAECSKTFEEVIDTLRAEVEATPERTYPFGYMPEHIHA